MAFRDRVSFVPASARWRVLVSVGLAVFAAAVLALWASHRFDADVSTVAPNTDRRHTNHLHGAARRNQ